MAQLAGGELCLPQRPHNQVGAARIRRRSYSRIINVGKVELNCNTYNIVSK